MLAHFGTNMDEENQVIKLYFCYNDDITKVWIIPKRPPNLEEEETYPHIHIKDYRHAVASPDQLEADHISHALVNFLEFDFKNYPILIERIDHVSLYLLDDFILSTYRFLKENNVQYS